MVSSITSGMQCAGDLTIGAACGHLTGSSYESASSTEQIQRVFKVHSSSSNLDSDYDTLLYFALVQSAGTALSFGTGTNANSLIGFLSSPTIRNAVCRQEFFQQLKQNLNQRFGVKIGLKALHFYLKRSAEIRIRDSVTRRLYELKQSDKDILMDNLRKQVLDRIEEHKEKFLKLAEEMGGGFNGSSKLAKISSEILNSLCSLDIPTPFLEQKVSDHGTLMSLYAAYSITSALPFIGPVAPLLLCKPSMTSAELAFRLGGMIVSTVTGAPLTSLLLTEAMTFGFAHRFQVVNGNADLTPVLNRYAYRGVRGFKELKNQMRQQFYNRGCRRNSVAKYERICSQLALGILYGAFTSQQHPLVSAVTNGTFVTGCGVIADRFQLADSKTFALQQGFVRTLPLLLLTGMTTTVLRALTSGGGELILSLVNSVATTPVVTDKIVKSEPYQRYVIDNIRNLILPNLWEVSTTLEVEQKVRKWLKLMPDGTPISGVKKLRWLVSIFAYLNVIGFVALHARRQQGLRHHVHSLRRTVRCAARVCQVYSRYLCARFVASYTLPSLGLATNLIGMPKDTVTALSSLAGMITLSCTDSQFLTTLSMEAARTALNNPQLRQVAHHAVQQAGPVVRNSIRPLTDRVNRQLYPDAATCASNLLGLGVSVSLGPVEGVLVSEMVNDTLRSNRVQHIAHRVCDFFLSALDDLVGTYDDMTAHFFGN